MSEELPKGWASGKLTEILYSVKTGVTKYTGEKKYYSTGSIQNHTYTSEGSYSFAKRPSRANRIAQLNDVFQARMKETDKGLLTTEELAEQLFSTGFLQLRSYSGTYFPKLLYYFIKSHGFLNQRDELATGSTQEALTDANSKELEIPLPPLNEQKHITAKLDQIMPKIDEVKERLERIPQILKRFRQSIIATACSGRLTADWRGNHPDVESASKIVEWLINTKKKKSKYPVAIEKIDNTLNGIPATWNFVKLKNIIHGIKYGTSKKCNYDNTTIPVIRIPNVVKGYIEHNDLKYTHLSDREFGQLKLGKDDILLVRSNGSVSLVGKAALVTQRESGFAYAGYLIRLRFNQKKIFAAYINCALATYRTRLQIELPARSTSGVHNINSVEVSNLVIPLPPFEEQQEIVSRVEVLFKKADEIEVRYHKVKTYVDKLTQSILAKAFRGELVPQDPNDEPVEKLLERIKEEKARLENEMKKNRRKTTRKKK